jgi:hypothetical protein
LVEERLRLTLLAGATGSWLLGLAQKGNELLPPASAKIIFDSVLSVEREEGFEPQADLFQFVANILAA